MDLIIKNLDHLRNYHNGHNVPIGKVVLDFDKLGKDDFTQIFFSACEKYKEPKIKSVDECMTCKYWPLNYCDEPCHSCYLLAGDKDHYGPAEPSLKEATERMQSEFDATGKDVKIFMNERVIKR